LGKLIQNDLYLQRILFLDRKKHRLHKDFPDIKKTGAETRESLIYKI
jgi:hypothetical protein